MKNVKVTYQPAVASHPTQKKYVDNAIDEKSLLRKNQNNDFNNNNVTSINSFNLTTQAINDNQVITKSYVDQFHQEKERSRRDLSLDFYIESWIW